MSCKAKRSIENSFMIISDNYIPCTETIFGDQPPVINLGDHDGSIQIASPMYPFMYYDGSACHWSIQASDPSLIIEIEVLEWDVRKTHTILMKYYLFSFL